MISLPIIWKHAEERRLSPIVYIYKWLVDFPKKLAQDSSKARFSI